MKIILSILMLLFMVKKDPAPPLEAVREVDLKKYS